MYNVISLSGGRWIGARQAVRQRLLADHHLPLRGLEPLLQEHVQAQTPARQVAGRRRQLSARASSPAQPERVHDGGAGGARPPTQEAHQHRQHDPRCAGARLQLQPQTHQRGDPLRERGALPGEGGGEGLVLQPATEGEEDEP